MLGPQTIVHSPEHPTENVHMIGVSETREFYFQQLGKKLEPANAGPPPDNDKMKENIFRNILIIYRLESRSFAAPYPHLAHLFSSYGYHVRPYFGNESFLETFELYSSSDIIVGFHGAGHINLVFSRPGTIGEHTHEDGS